MYPYNVQKLVSLLTEIIKAQVDAPVFDWLLQQPGLTENVTKLNASLQQCRVKQAK